MLGQRSRVVAGTRLVHLYVHRHYAGQRAAHFLEHLLFNGTTSRTQEELYADVDRIGAYNNAATRKDYAVFMFVVGWESAEEGLPSRPT